MIKVAISSLFYVQEERYVMVPWMERNDHVQEERYVMVPWMARNDHVQEERFVMVCNGGKA
jgi:hypothetical protein